MARVQCRCLGDIAVLVIDNPPVNATTMSIRSSLLERLREVSGDPAVSNSLGIERRKTTDAQIMNRILLSMVNEGARIIGEGHAARASDIDVTYANGYGFPRYHGGPMFWAERQGLANILARVRENERRAGKLWSPAPLLDRAAVAGTWRAAEAALLR